MSESSAAIDALLVELSTKSESSPRALALAVNSIHSALEGAALLGSIFSTRFVGSCFLCKNFSDRISRSIRLRIPVEAPFASRFVQTMGRVLQSRSEPAWSVIAEGLRPLKSSLLSHALSRLHDIVARHDFAENLQATVFVDTVSLF